MEQIGKLTDRQMSLIYFRPKKEERREIPEPESDDDVRAWCASVKDNFPQMPDEEYEAWVEKSVIADRARREEKLSGEEKPKSGEPV